MGRFRLVVGLGNPGNQYQDNRHNVGFKLIDMLADKLKQHLVMESKFFGEMVRFRCNGDEIILLKPMTFMNLSGKSVGSVANFYKIKPEEILIIHDELDFTSGVIKIKQGGSSGGHNGLKDIDRVMPNNYWRLRVGIGHPGDKDKVAGYVLTNPSRDQQDELYAVYNKFINLFDSFEFGDFNQAQKMLHSKE